MEHQSPQNNLEYNIKRLDMDNFEKMLHEMFDDIWDCEIDHPLFQDTVGDLMKAVIEAHKRAQLDFDITAKIDKAYDDGYDA